MNQVGCRLLKQGSGGTGLDGACARQNGSLYWTALMITGDAETAERSVIDATGLGKKSGGAFDEWLLEWAHLATARAAVNAVRSSIRQAAAQYAQSSSPNRKPEPLSPAEVRLLQQVNAPVLAQSLDVLARAVLILYGCQRLSFSDCTLVLNVSVQLVKSAYGRARQWFDNSAALSERFRHSKSTQLGTMRYDADGIAVWG